MPRLFFIEPSKAGYQHITFINGCLRALWNSSLRKKFILNFYGSKSTISNLDREVAGNFLLHEIDVIDPRKRRLIFKTFQEAKNVLKLILTARADDKIVISCILPTALILVEVANRIFKRGNVFVMLHGELEGLAARSVDPRRIGTWSRLWVALFAKKSVLNYIVLEDFIRRKLLSLGIPAGRLHVVHHVIEISEQASVRHQKITACIVGYLTKNKGFEAVIGLSKRLPHVRFLAIGGGKVVDLRTNSETPLSEKAEFLRAVSRCHFALCLFNDGYEFTLSASALDAVSAGVKVIGLDRPFLRNLAQVFPGVRVFRSVDEVASYLEGNFLDWQIDYQIDCTPYCLDSIRMEFEQIL